MNFYYIKCIKCKQKFFNDKIYTKCPKCNSPLDVIYDYNYIKSKLNIYDLEHTPISALKYLDFYPIKDRTKVISRGEGNTPIYRLERLEREIGFSELYLKDEGANPTGVFKDRGSLVEITKAIELSAKAICVASTGNMAASVACYASIAKLPCFVLVPEGTPIGKLAQTLSYGANIIQIRGTYESCSKLAEEMAEKHSFYLAGDYAFRLEGQKSQAYEIVEQFFWSTPDYVIVPVGVGTNISAIWKGFKEFYKLGLIKKLPKMIAVQPSGCSPICSAFLSKSKKIKKVIKPYTIASAVAAGNPFDAPKVLKLLKESNGMAVIVSDIEILEMQKILAKKESIFLEPSSALSVAGFLKLFKKKKIKNGLKVVCIGTGNGLKDPKSIVSNYPMPPSINPDIKEIDRYLNHKLYNLQTIKFEEKNKILIKKKIEKISLKKLIKKEFNININSNTLDVLLKEINDFLKKGEFLTKIDLQHIIEDVLKVSYKEKLLEILDYEVKAYLNKNPEAFVKVKFKDKIYKAKSKGVGPFDAIINALWKAIKNKNNLRFDLIDYKVEIDTASSDATVKVTMMMEDDKKNKIESTATSKDVIEASVKAYEKGYNLLNALVKNQS